ncbi:MAG: LapB repeat-containing protein, partial [Culicoidibacterales bacterium]
MKGIIIFLALNLLFGGAVFSPVPVVASNESMQQVSGPDPDLITATYKSYASNTVNFIRLEQHIEGLAAVVVSFNVGGTFTANLETVTSSLNGMQVKLYNKSGTQKNTWSAASVTADGTNLINALRSWTWNEGDVLFQTRTSGSYSKIHFLDGRIGSFNASNPQFNIVLTKNANLDVNDITDEVISGKGIEISAGEVATINQTIVSKAAALAYKLADGVNVPLTQIDTASVGSLPGVYNAIVKTAKGTQKNISVRVIDDISPIITSDSEITYEKNRFLARVTESQFLVDISASIDEAGTITSDFITIVDLTTVGDYLVTLRAKDTHNNIAIPVSVMVHVVDTIIPVLSATDSIIYERGVPVVEAQFLAGIDATLNEDGVITSDLVAVVDFNVSGDYLVTLNGTDLAGNVANPLAVTVTVSDQRPPVLTGKVGQEYVLNTVKTEAEFLLDIEATLDEPGVVTSNFEAAVDLTVAGVYKVTLEGEDVDNNPANSIIVTVLVTDDPNTKIDVDNKEMIVAYPFTVNESDFSGIDFIEEAKARAWDVLTGAAAVVNVKEVILNGDGTNTLIFDTNKQTEQTVLVTLIDDVPPVIIADASIVYERTIMKDDATFLLDVSASLTEAGVVTSNFEAAVDLNVAGEYTVELTGVDTIGNNAIPVNVNVVVSDTVEPILNADAAITYPIGTLKTENSFLSEVSATLDEPGVITSDFVLGVDLSVSGVYKVTLGATDTAGNVAAPKEVMVLVTDGANTEVNPLNEEFIRAYPFTVNLSDVGATDFVLNAQAEAWNTTTGATVGVTLKNPKPTVGGAYNAVFETGLGTTITVVVTVTDN